MNRPALKATFVTNEKGEPEFIESNGVKHYKIKLALDEVPEDAYAVTYELDDSYYDPIRENHDPSSGFTEELTSYGDYNVNVKVRSRMGTRMMRSSLAEALEFGYRDQPSAAVRSAIEVIRKL